MTTVSDSEWMTAAEAAAMIGIKVGTLYSWRSTPQRVRGPKSYRVGGRVKYRRSEVEAWMLRDVHLGDDEPR